MKIEHITGMETAYTMGLRPDGRELMVVCLKGTFTIPENGGTPQLAKDQLPLVDADVFTGEPGVSAPLYESDYAPFKPHCDVLLNGSAYAPNGKPTRKVDVHLSLGPVSKSFSVVGNRYWKSGTVSTSATKPELFTQMPISYDCAFGGADKNHKNPDKHKYYPTNPIGQGFHYYSKSRYIDGKPLPNTEEFRRPVKKPGGKYRPMAFGSIPRSWPDRVKLAGTYDQDWQDNTFPFLPADFDNAYFQAAPKEQQMPYPKSGEKVCLINLTPEGRTEFALPRINLLAWFFLKNGEEIGKELVPDTVMIEPDERRLTMTCRASLPLKKNMMEVEMVVLGLDTKEREEVLKANETEDE